MQSGITDIQNYSGIQTANTFRYFFYIKESTNTRDRKHPVLDCLYILIYCFPGADACIA